MEDKYISTKLFINGSWVNSFKNSYNDSELMDEMESKLSELSEINNI